MLRCYLDDVEVWYRNFVILPWHDLKQWSRRGVFWTHSWLARGLAVWRCPSVLFKLNKLSHFCLSHSLLIIEPTGTFTDNMSSFAPVLQSVPAKASLCHIGALLLCLTRTPTGQTHTWRRLQYLTALFLYSNQRCGRCCCQIKVNSSL